MFYYGFGYFSYFPLYLLAILVVAIASSSVRSAYQKYSRVRNERMMTGEQAARRILQIAHLDDVDIQYARGGALSDHYDPRRKIVALSKACYEDDSVASISIAAHECGHAIQDAQGYFFLRVRDAPVPVVNIASQLGWILLVFGLLSFSSSTSLFNLGLILLSVSLLFQIVTLPVEIDASRRALRILSENDLIEQTQLPMAKAMLRAAAFTYVAGVLSTMLQLLRIFLMTRRDER